MAKTKLLRILVAWLACTAFGACPGCVTAAPADPAAGARVHADWQKKMFAKLSAGQDGMVDAWGLFSSGGWADAGQVMVLADAAHQHGRLLIVAPNAKDFATDRPLSAKELAAFLGKLNGANELPDVNMAVFDGIVYEYVNAKRDDDGSVRVLKRAYDKSSGTQPQAGYDGLIAAFQALRKAP